MINEIEEKIQAVYNLTAHRPLRILEIGCGDARVFYYLKQKYNIHYQAIEYSALSYFKAYNTFHADSNFRISFGDPAEAKSYASLPSQDVVLCLYTFNFLPNEAIQKTIENVKRYCPKKFLILIKNKNCDWRFIRNVLKQNFSVVKSHNLPCRLLPKCLSNFIYFECY